MKLVVIGFGQCGGRIADEFARLNQRARSHRKIEIITGAFAVNTDAADLSGLATIPTDYKHRILIGGRKTGGHGSARLTSWVPRLPGKIVTRLLMLSEPQNDLLSQMPSFSLLAPPVVPARVPCR